MLPSSRFPTNDYTYLSTNGSDDQLHLQEEGGGSVVQGNFGDDQNHEYEETTGTCSGAVEKRCSTKSALSSSATDTFVEDMLARDAEMQLQFLDIFGENYDDC